VLIRYQACVINQNLEVSCTWPWHADALLAASLLNASVPIAKLNWNDKGSYGKKGTQGHGFLRWMVKPNSNWSGFALRWVKIQSWDAVQKCRTFVSREFDPGVPSRRWIGRYLLQGSRSDGWGLRAVSSFACRPEKGIRLLSSLWLCSPSLSTRVIIHAQTPNRTRHPNDRDKFLVLSFFIWNLEDAKKVNNIFTFKDFFNM